MSYQEELHQKLLNARREIAAYHNEVIRIMNKIGENINKRHSELVVEYLHKQNPPVSEAGG